MQFYSLDELIKATFKEFCLVWRRFFLIGVPSLILGTIAAFYISFLRSGWTADNHNIFGPIGIIFDAKLNPDFFLAKSQSIIILFLEISATVVSFISHLAIIVVFRDRKKKFHYLPIYKEAVVWTGPWLITGLIAWVLKFGAFWLLWLPAVVFGVWFTLNRFVVIYRHQWGNQSLITSRELIRGYGWTIWLFKIVEWIFFSLAIIVINLFAFNEFRHGGYGWRSLSVSLFSLSLSWIMLIFNALIYERLSLMKPKLKPGKSYPYWLVALIGYLLIGGLIFGAVKTGDFERWFNRVFPATNYYNYPPEGYTIEEYQQKLKDDEDRWKKIQSGEEHIIDNGLTLYFPTKYNPEIKVDYDLVFNKIRAYYLYYGYYPDDLDQLQERYFGSHSIPFNQLTGQPFNYHPRANRNGVNIGFTLCPKIEDPLEYCYRQ